MHRCWLLLAVGLFSCSGCSSSTENKSREAAQPSQDRLDKDLLLEDDPPLLALHTAAQEWGGSVRKYKVEPAAGANAPDASSATTTVDDEPRIYVQLDLSSTNVDDEKFAQLAEQPAFQEMTSVILGGTQISDKSLEHLAHAGNLEMIDFTNTRVTDKGLAYLKAHPKLRYIVIDGTQISYTAADALLRGLPALRGQ